jgi:hypothetical protein
VALPVQRGNKRFPLWKALAVGVQQVVHVARLIF